MTSKPLSPARSKTARRAIVWLLGVGIVLLLAFVLRSRWSAINPSTPVLPAMDDSQAQLPLNPAPIPYDKAKLQGIATRLASVKLLQSPQAALQAAQLARQAGNVWLAIEWTRTAIQLNPADLNARLSLGDLLQEVAAYDAAAAQYQSVFQSDKAEAEPYIGLASIAFTLHHPAEVAHWMQQAQRDMNPSVENLIMLARAYQDQNNYADAKSVLDRALQKDPQSADIALQRASLWITYAQLEQARPLLEDLIQKHPENGLAHRLLGVLISNPAYKQPDMMRARILLERAAELNPTDGTIYRAIAPIYRQQHLLRLAAQSYDALLTLEPRDEEGRSGLAQLYGQLGLASLSGQQMKLFTMLHEQNRQISQLKTVLATHPQDATAHFAIARYADSQERYALAFQEYQAASICAPQDKQMALAVAQFATKLGWPAPKAPQL